MTEALISGREAILAENNRKGKLLAGIGIEGSTPKEKTVIARSLGTEWYQGNRVHSWYTLSSPFFGLRGRVEIVGLGEGYPEVWYTYGDQRERVPLEQLEIKFQGHRKPELPATR